MLVRDSAAVAVSSEQRNASVAPLKRLNLLYLSTGSSSISPGRLQPEISNQQEYLSVQNAVQPK
jgi:hypothetical protein